MGERISDKDRRREELLREVEQKSSLARYLNNFHLYIPASRQLVNGQMISGSHYDTCNYSGKLDKRPTPDGPTPPNMGWRRARKTEREFLVDITETAKQLGLLDLLIECQLDTIRVSREIKELEAQRKEAEYRVDNKRVDLLDKIIEFIQLQRDAVNKRYYTLAVPLYVDLRLRGYTHHDLTV